MEIVRTYRQKIPAARFIGIKYGDPDRVNGTFGAKWGEWFASGNFEKIERALGENKDKSPLYEDGGAYLGFMRWKEGEPFEYWIGMFAPPETAVPEGFASIEFGPRELGVCWLRGAESTLYANEGLGAEKLGEEGFSIIPEPDGSWYFFERYVCPRFTTPDENGEVILDICHYIK